ncbi:bacillithiol system redox-active protein YtxJ [Evansella sp. AB-rgal1]|uniref:bacillithiol system redox-active protein YtxJ n=1 Tax=Evansella sp. AB-rgal1 TaxID=3242696 RepID=UPI00359E000C
MSIKKIDQNTDFQKVLSENTKFYLLKNSTTCPISMEAYNETKDFSSNHEEIPVFYLNVQESRPLSNEIAETYNVKHESPQVLLFEEGNVKWNDSHWRITKQSLEQAWG